jgi:tetratricopeptide (TPR) repeat protein
VRCRDQRPADPVSYGVIGDAHLELGDYDEAFDAFDRMVTLRPNAASYARVAYAREIQGDLAGALQTMRLAAAASEGGDVEATAWYRAQVGELDLKLGKNAEAEQAFADASQAYPGHPFAVSGYARVLEAEGRHREARQLLEDLLKRNAAPEIHARVGDLYEREGRHEEARKHWTLAEAAWRDTAPEPKNLARFLAERGEKIDDAVAIAEQAASLRDDIFTDDALAWAYFKAGRIAEARTAIDRALRTGSRDAEILRHAAAIRQEPAQMARR